MQLLSPISITGISKNPTKLDKVSWP